MKVAFVCTGNTCRSGMAEALARKWLEINSPDCTNIQLESAGLAAVPGLPASFQSVEVMGCMDIDLKGHRAKQFSLEFAMNSDLILTMTESHKRLVGSLYPAAAAKTFTLAEFATGQSFDICDPYGQSVAVYKKCALELENLVRMAMEKVAVH